MKRVIILSIAILSSLLCSAKYEVLEPDGTYLYARKDSTDLYLDIFEPAKDSQTSIGEDTKPTILYVFGGGFKEGERNSKWINRWFRSMTENGYRVVTIDYRLGLKGFKGKTMSLDFINALKAAVEMAVSDTYSATSFILNNAESLGIDPSRIVIAGSSAGAITCMQAEYELCNRLESASALPQDFNYAGAMSFAGAIFTKKGAPSYKTEPCPTLMLHGTADQIVPYGKIQFLGYWFGGSGALYNIFEKNSYNFQMLRFKDRSHEIASCMHRCLPEEFRFLEENVIKGQKRIVDATIDDPSIPAMKKLSKADDLYK